MPGEISLYRLRGPSHPSIRRLWCPRPSLVIWAALENKGFVVLTGFRPNERNIWCGNHIRISTRFVIHAKGHSFKLVVHLLYSYLNQMILR